MKERGDCEERVEGRPKGDRNMLAGKVKVSARLGSEEESIGEGEGHGGQDDGAHEMGEGD